MKKGLDVLWCDGRAEDGEELHFCDLNGGNVFFVAPSGGFGNWVTVLPTSGTISQAVWGNFNIVPLTDFMKRGYDRTNYINRIVRWHSLELMMQFYANALAVAPTTSETIVVDLVWVEFPAGVTGEWTAMPALSAFFKDETPNGYTSTDPFSFPNLGGDASFMGGFKILATHRLFVPVSQDAVGEAGVASSVSDDTTHSWCLKLDLRGFESEFVENGAAFATRRGRLYLCFRGTATVATFTPFATNGSTEIAWKARLLFYGGE